MAVRFPDLVPPVVRGDPTQDEIESGLWCPPDFYPDESNLTLLPADASVAQAFANMTPECFWAENDQQVVVSVSSPHLADPDHGFYADLPKLVRLFDKATQGKSRVGVKEGRLWSPESLRGDDRKIIQNGRDMPFFQSLIQRRGIPCLSAEPIKDKEMLAVKRIRPDLTRAVTDFVCMRMLPQLWAKQDHYKGFDHLPATSDLRPFVFERRGLLRDNPWGAGKLYPVTFDDPARLNAITGHLFSEHSFSVRPEVLNNGPSDEIREQVFRCTNPLFQQASTDQLCEMQKISILISRLRDRRFACMVSDLGRKGLSLFFLSGPPHYEVTLPGLLTLTAERSLSVRHNVTEQLGLLAIRPAH